jgi:DNA segregation ATPase FtsK/SpoIIIE-like protein
MIKIAIAFLLGCLLCLNLSELPATGWWLALLLAPLIWFRQWLLSGLIVGLLWTGFQAQHRLDQQLPEPDKGREQQYQQPSCCGQLTQVQTQQAAQQKPDGDFNHISL